MIRLQSSAQSPLPLSVTSSALREVAGLGKIAFQLCLAITKILVAKLGCCGKLLHLNVFVGEDRRVERSKRPRYLFLHADRNGGGDVKNWSCPPQVKRERLL